MLIMLVVVSAYFYTLNTVICVCFYIDNRKLATSSNARSEFDISNLVTTYVHIYKVFSV